MHYILCVGTESLRAVTVAVVLAAHDAARAPAHPGGGERRAPGAERRDS